jgi:hypothetical protein
MGFLIWAICGFSYRLYAVCGKSEERPEIEAAGLYKGE